MSLSPSGQSERGVYEDRVNLGNLESNIVFLNKTAILDKNQKILEIGSGRGALLSYLIKQGFDAVGIEINKNYINEGREIFGDLPIRLTNGVDLPFENGQFDVVISFDVFEHIRNSDSHINEVARVLKTGGYYLLQTPNQFTNFLFAMVIRRRRFSEWHEDHCALHNYWSLKKRFQNHNFKVVFYDIPVVNDFFKIKLRRFAGRAGIFMLRIINPDRLPQCLRTNFYIKARKSATSTAD